jgi:hypothetical protein
MTLSSKTWVKVERINDWGYIPELKIIGPVGKRMVRMDSLVNMLNRKVDIKLPIAWVEKIYLFVKQYNLTVDQSKHLTTARKADVAELLLESKLFKDIRRIQDEDRLDNPLDDDLSDSEISQIERKYIQGAIARPMKIRKKGHIPKPKHYEIFEKVEVATTGDASIFNEIELQV